MTLEIRMRLGEHGNHLMADELKNAISSGSVIPADTAVSLTKPKRPVGGLGLTVPPELVVAIGTAVATTTASEIVKLLWSILREKVLPPAKTSRPSTFTIVVNGQAIMVNSEEMADPNPPKAFQASVATLDK